MKKFISYVFLILIIGCSQAGQENNSNKDGERSKITCSNSVSYGDIQICMPEVDGMKECYSNPNVKQFADRTAGEGSSILAYYLNNSTFQNINNLDSLMNLGDFFQVYAVDAMRDEKFGQDMLDQFQNMLEQMCSGGEIWNTIKEKIERGNYNGITEKPIKIESYSLNENVRTIITLNKSQLGSYVVMEVKTINFVLIKEKIIALSYCNKYDGNSSIENAKSKNDSFVQKFLDVNR